MPRRPDRQQLQEKIRFQVQYSSLYALWFLRWLVFGAVTGAVCGLAGAALHVGIDLTTAVRQGHPWLLFLLPAAGLLIVGAYHAAGLREDPGTSLVLYSIQSKEPIPLKMAPLIFCGTLLTHLCGGSAGRVGAALQVGGSIGEALGGLFRLKDTDIHIIVICGMSAAFTAIFGTPIAAAVFSIEVISVGIVHYSALVPSAVSAAIAYAILQRGRISLPRFPQFEALELSAPLFLRVILLAILCGLVSILFCYALRRAVALYTKVLPNDYLRVFVGGLLVIALTLLSGSDAYNGYSAELLQLSMTGTCPTFAFLLKILFTAVTLGAGFKGGEIAPALVVGATLGNVAAPLLGLDPAFGAAIGMIALFCGVVNCPLAAVLFSVELFGHANALLFFVACAVSYVFSGYYGLYRSQKIVYDKLHPKYINTRTR